MQGSQRVFKCKMKYYITFCTALDIFHSCTKENKILYLAACDHLKDNQDYQRGSSRKSK